jgi:hypothetical protein
VVLSFDSIFGLARGQSRVVGCQGKQTFPI